MEAQRRQGKRIRTNITEKKSKNRRKHRNTKSCRISAPKSLSKDEVGMGVCVRYLNAREKPLQDIFTNA